jgi:hypothetical protein
MIKIARDFFVNTVPEFFASAISCIQEVASRALVFLSSLCNCRFSWSDRSVVQEKQSKGMFSIFSSGVKTDPRKTLEDSYEDFFKNLDGRSEGDCLAILQEAKRLRHESIVKSLEYFRSLGFGFCEMKKDFTMDKRGVIEVPGDGNCLFYSMETALKLVSDLALEAHEIRQMAVSYLKEHKEDAPLQIALLGTLMTYQEQEIAHLSEQNASLSEVLSSHLVDDEQSVSEQILLNYRKIEEISSLTVEEYLDLASQDKFFGGEAEVYAMSQLFHVSIRVKNVDLQGRCFSRVEYNPRQERVITLIHEPAHYNLDMS